MTPLTGVAEQLGGGMPESPTPAENIILLSEEDFAKGARVHAAEGAGEEDPAASSGNRTSGSELAQPEWLADVERLKEAGGIPEKPLYYRFVKRAFDIAFSSYVIVVGLIPGLVLSAFIVADTKGSPIYTSTRLGRNGSPFRILKFRSMVADADDLEKYFTPEQLDEWHREHKVEDDPRITKLGAFLRSSSIDEFPQFINVFLCGIPQFVNHVGSPKSIFDVELDGPLPVLVRVHDLNPPIVADWYGFSSAPPFGYFSLTLTALNDSIARFRNRGV